MNTSILVLLFIVGVAYSVPTWPAEHESEDAAWAPLESVIVDHLRFRRATCDLFSFKSQWVTPNHAVCAGKCIAMGKRGGECRGTSCHCRG